MKKIHFWIYILPIGLVIYYKYLNWSISVDNLSPDENIDRLRFPKKPKYIQTDTDDLESDLNKKNGAADSKTTKKSKEARSTAKSANEIYLEEYSENNQVQIYLYYIVGIDHNPFYFITINK